MAKKKQRVESRALADEPVSGVVWVPRRELRPNDYNPNNVAPPELELLIISILEDGWTQPIVTLPPDKGGWRDIVDGFHRYTVSADDRLMSLYGGFVPVVQIKLDPVHRRMSTIRHNRARGVHAVMPMANIVQGMVKDGVSQDDVKRRLGMEQEEVDRLVDRAGMTRRGAGKEFGRSFVPQGMKVKRGKK